VKIANQDAVVVNLPVTVTRGYRFVLAVSYSGILDPQPIDREALELEPQYPIVQEEGPVIPLEPSYLYSNRSDWYPQPDTSGYAKARMRLTVPPGFSCAASGDLVTTVTLPAAPRSQPAHQFHFVSMQPARYLSCLITPLVDVRRERLDLDDIVERFRADRSSGVYYDVVHLNVKSQPRLQRAGRQMAGVASDVIRFYASLTGEAPYPTLTLALVERELPGGHSPPYLVVVSQAVPGSRLSYRDDPASFSEFPEFFLAHELAHQWWGQGVGWKNYHEQWLSEGFAQYFAALYAEKARGTGVFGNMMRRMRRFAMEESSQGPIWLGYRVGHVKGDSRVFRSVVYNKSAVVLHMLRRLMGDEAFFRGVRRFLDTWRFKRAGTDDLRAAMEKEAGRPLGRFFERWIHGASLPQVTFNWREEGSGDDRQAVLRFEQTDEIFDFPLQATITYEDRAPADVVALLTEKVTELRVPLAGRVRSIETNRDGLALVEVK
jgi:hypothetical protein